MNRKRETSKGGVESFEESDSCFSVVVVGGGGNGVGEGV